MSKLYHHWLAVWSSSGSTESAYFVVSSAAMSNEESLALALKQRDDKEDLGVQALRFIHQLEVPLDVRYVFSKRATIEHLELIQRAQNTLKELYLSLVLAEELAINRKKEAATNNVPPWLTLLSGSLAGRRVCNEFDKRGGDSVEVI